MVCVPPLGLIQLPKLQRCLAGPGLWLWADYPFVTTTDGWLQNGRKSSRVLLWEATCLLRRKIVLGGGNVGITFLFDQMRTFVREGQVLLSPSFCHQTQGTAVSGKAWCLHTHLSLLSFATSPGQFMTAQGCHPPGCVDRSSERG